MVFLSCHVLLFVVWREVNGLVLHLMNPGCPSKVFDVYHHSTKDCSECISNPTWHPPVHNPALLPSLINPP